MAALAHALAQRGACTRVRGRESRRASRSSWNKRLPNIDKFGGKSSPRALVRISLLNFEAEIITTAATECAVHRNDSREVAQGSKLRDFCEGLCECPIVKAIHAAQCQLSPSPLRTRSSNCFHTRKKGEEARNSSAVRFLILQILHVGRAVLDPAQSIRDLLCRVSNAL